MVWVLKATTSPGVPITFRGKPISGAFEVMRGAPPLVIGDANSPIHASLRIQPRVSRGPTLYVVANPPLDVTFDGETGPTPRTIELREPGDLRPTILLVNPATGGRVELRLMLRP